MRIHSRPVFAFTAGAQLFSLITLSGFYSCVPWQLLVWLWLLAAAQIFALIADPGV